MKKIVLTLKLIWQGWRNYFLDIVSDIKYKRYFDERYCICQKCGCVLNAKTKAEDAECPVGKWKTIEEMLSIKSDERKN